jgi:hypothetical protein
MRLSSRFVILPVYGVPAGGQPLWILKLHHYQIFELFAACCSSDAKRSRFWLRDREVASRPSPRPGVFTCNSELPSTRK